MYMPKKRKVKKLKKTIKRTGGNHLRNTNNIRISLGGRGRARASRPSGMRQGSTAFSQAHISMGGFQPPKHPPPISNTTSTPHGLKNPVDGRIKTPEPDGRIYDPGVVKPEPMDIEVVPNPNKPVKPEVVDVEDDVEPMDIEPTVARLPPLPKPDKEEKLALKSQPSSMEIEKRPNTSSLAKVKLEGVNTGLKRERTNHNPSSALVVAAEREQRKIISQADDKNNKEGRFNKVKQQRLNDKEIVNLSKDGDEGFGGDAGMDYNYL